MVCIEIKEAKSYQITFYILKSYYTYSANCKKLRNLAEDQVVNLFV